MEKPQFLHTGNKLASLFVQMHVSSNFPYIWVSDGKENKFFRNCRITVQKNV